jgi:phage shock protein PspC (stress-responsive transcriptional regulator)
MSRLTLSYSDRIIGGVCGGIAEYFGWDATIIRILFAIAAIVGFGSPVLIYLVLWVVMRFS